VTRWRLGLAALACIMAGVLVAWVLTGPGRSTPDPADRTAVPASPSRSASPPKPAAHLLVLDEFDRSSVRNGLGQASLGGKCSIVADKPDRPDYAVSDGRGIFNLSRPGLGRSGYLGSVQEKSTDVLVSFNLDKLTEDGPVYVTVLGRRIDHRRAYATDLLIDNRGRVRVSLTAFRNSKNGETISPRIILPGAVRPGDQVHVRMQTFRVHPTQVQAKVWWGGDSPEPEDWSVVKMDKDRDLQRAGAVGFSTYLSVGATNAPVRVSLLDITARAVV
jgi:hypothetical protein